MLPTSFMPEYYRDAKDIVWKAGSAPEQRKPGLLTRLLRLFQRAPQTADGRQAKGEGTPTPQMRPH